MRSAGIHKLLVVMLGVLMLQTGAVFAQATQPAPAGPSPAILFDDIKLLLIARNLKITPEQATPMAIESQKIAALFQQEQDLKAAAYRELEPALGAALQAATSGAKVPPQAQQAIDKVMGALQAKLPELAGSINLEYDKVLQSLPPEQQKLIMTPEEEAQARAEIAGQHTRVMEVLSYFTELPKIPREEFNANKDAWATQYLAYIFGPDDSRVKNRKKQMINAMQRAHDARPDQLARFIQQGSSMFAMQFGVTSSLWDPYKSKQVPLSLFEEFLAHPRTATLLNLYAARGGKK